jgi:hypothetical protein
MSTELLEAPVTTTPAAPALVKVKGERMTGQALLDFVQQNKDNAIDEVVYNAGYYTKTTDTESGETKTTLHKPQFFQALTVASTGVEFAPPKRAYAARKGRKPVVTVVKNGNIVVGSRHGSIAGFDPGSKVKVESAPGKIILTAWEDAENTGVDADAEIEEEDELDI